MKKEGGKLPDPVDRSASLTQLTSYNLTAVRWPMAGDRSPPVLQKVLRAEWASSHNALTGRLRLAGNQRRSNSLSR